MYRDRSLVKDNPLRVRVDAKVDGLLEAIINFRGGQKLALAREYLVLGLEVAISTDPELKSMLYESGDEVLNKRQIAA